MCPAGAGRGALKFPVDFLFGDALIGRPDVLRQIQDHFVPPDFSLLVDAQPRRGRLRPEGGVFAALFFVSCSALSSRSMGSSPFRLQNLPLLRVRGSLCRSRCGFLFSKIPPSPPGAPCLS